MGPTTMNNVSSDVPVRGNPFLTGRILADGPRSHTHHPLGLSTMGTGHTAKKKGARSKNKQYKRKVWLKNRDKDVDQIQDELELEQQTGVAVTDRLVPAYDDDLPGGGQFYCVETGRHFISQKALDDHKKTKFYKRRLKQLAAEKYTQGTAEWASGKTKEKLPPAHGGGDEKMSA